jgi:hypothetical protein
LSNYGSMYFKNSKEKPVVCTLKFWILIPWSSTISLSSFFTNTILNSAHENVIF